MKKNLPLILIGVVAAILLLFNPFYVINPTQQVVVLWLQQPMKVIKEPGLNFKVPYFHEIRYFDNRLLDYDSAATEVITRDKKTLMVDNFAKWRISDPLRFLETVRDENGAQSRLDDIIYSELRVEMGRHALREIVASKRSEIMEVVTQRANEKFKDYGLEVIDVRVKRADLPQQNAKSIYSRMKAERERIAKRYRSEGAEEATKIRAETDKEKEIILAEAYKEEQKIRGEGDAISTKIYADAYSKDFDFYGFQRSLEAYRKSLGDKTTILLSPESEFLRYFNKK